MSTVTSVASTPPREVAGDLGPGQDLRFAKGVVVRGAVDTSLVLAGGALTVEGRAGGSTLTSGEDMTLQRAHSCEITAGGSLWILGSGATDCDIDVAADLIALGAQSAARAGFVAVDERLRDLIAPGPDGAIRSGLVRVGGCLRVGELSGREGARLRLVMTATDSTDDLVLAGVVQAGVEIVAAGELLRFDRRHGGVRISIHDGRARLTST